MNKNILLKIKYDGSRFHGWQRQVDVRTVQETIEKALGHIAGHPIQINGTSRTDSGVHALEQCASFVWDNKIPTEKLAMVLNNHFTGGRRDMCSKMGDLMIISAEEMPAEFHARYSCKGKTYRYIIDSSGNLFERDFVYQLKLKLDIEAMKKAADQIVGTHDFKSFEAAGGAPRESTIRTISAFEICEEGSKIIMEITGDGFLYNMVRIIVGTLVEVGIGKKSYKEINRIIKAKDRSLAGFTAPAEGLYLKEIYFSSENIK